MLQEPSMHNASQLSEALRLPIPQRLSRLLELCEGHDAAGSSGDLVSALSGLLAESALSSRDRMLLGEALGKLGDPRLRQPSQPDYWINVKLDEGYAVSVGRYMVTNAEWVSFIRSGSYSNDEFWTEEGREWRKSDRPSWQELASDPESAPLIIPNQPVVGVSWFEAVAYATASGARLLDFDERVRIMRGMEKRPYPWGAPFGQGNANTREEVLSKPSAVGVFPGDCTPEGVYDLSGNVGEWTADHIQDGRRVIHPGSWQQPSMAAWAKALHIVSAAARSADLGFRIVKDH
jgi:formylglycine-generating enzyme required for sulfatase activity